MAIALSDPVLPTSSRPAGDLPCLYCDGTDFEPLYDNIHDRLGHVPGDWSFVRCTNCGSANLRPFPKAEDLPSFYPPVYTFSPELANSPLKRLLAALEYRLFFQPVYRAQVRIVDRHIRRHGGRPGKLLDIGCGRGLRLLEFRRWGYEVHAMDFVQESLDYLQESHGIPGVCTPIEGLDSAFANASFDVVTAFYILEHVVSVRESLEQCLSLLKPGGWFCGAVPMIDSCQAQLFGDREMNAREAPRHLSLPTQSAIKSVCRDAGFAPDSIQFVPDAAMTCAGTASLSLLPAASTTQVYGAGKFCGLACRLLGALGVFALTPVALVENFVFRRPVLGLVVAQRPL